MCIYTFFEENITSFFERKHIIPHDPRGDKNLDFFNNNNYNSSQMTLEFVQIDRNQGKDEELLKQMDDQRRYFNLTWDAYCKHLSISKKSIFRWKKEKKIGKAYRRIFHHFLDENEKALNSLRRDNI